MKWKDVEGSMNKKLDETVKDIECSFNTAISDLGLEIKVPICVY